MPTRMIENIKKPVADLYPVVEGLRCVEVMIPDDDSYLPVLAAFIAVLGNAWAWLGTPTDRADRAYLWQVAYAATDWEQCMDCEEVAACIVDSEEVQQALSDWFVTQAGDSSSDVYTAIQEIYNSNVGGQPMPASVSGAGLYDTGCVEDVLFGAIYYTIDRMDKNNIDAFEIAEELSEPLERASTLISGIPIFETLPIDEVIDYAQALWTDDLFENYSAAVTTDYLDSLKCDLFCIALDNDCTLSIDLLFHYFVERIGGDPTNDLLQLITYLTAGVWTGTQVPDTFFALQLIAMKLGNQFFSTIGIKSIVGYMAIGARMPDSTWSIICDACPDTYVHDFDLTTSLFDWEIVPADSAAPFGHWETGVGVVYSDVNVAGLPMRGVFIAIGLAIPSITSVTLILDYEAGDSLPAATIWEDATPVAIGAPDDGTDVEKQYLSDFAITAQLGIQIDAAYQGTYSGNVVLKHVIVRGEGADPF